jgi:hypothetical protein
MSSKEQNSKKFMVFLLFFTFAGNSYAYVDPGTGVFLVQSMIALVVSVLFYVRNPSQLIRLIREKLRKKKSDESKKTD